MTKFTDKDLLRASIFEAVRWWLNFDGPQLAVISKSAAGITPEQVRAIALQYNFGRHIPKEIERVKLVANTANKLSGRVFETYDERAAVIECCVKELHEKLVDTASGSRPARVVSGLTKLTWFVAPEKWTPYDNLAATALNAKPNDTLKRMRTYYRKLDDIGFAESSARLAVHAQNTPFENIFGERILDKYLMFKGDDARTKKVLPLVQAFPEGLPHSWRRDILSFAEKAIGDDCCYPDLDGQL